jgi:hypothetical protein
MSNKGPVEILCQEIGVKFKKKMESTSTLVSFVSVLVKEIEEMMVTEDQLSEFTGKEVSKKAIKSLECIKNLLTIKDRGELIKGAAKAHIVAFVHDDGPCDHYVDMISSCISVIRFGLESPCRSRHAASAAKHVWKHRYSIKLFDNYSNSWGNQWSKAKLYEVVGYKQPLMIRIWFGIKSILHRVKK